jgi:hypothetical protein
MINGFAVVGLTRNNELMCTGVYDTQQKAIDAAALHYIILTHAKVLWFTADKEVTTVLPVVNVEIT